MTKKIWIYIRDNKTINLLNLLIILILLVPYSYSFGNTSELEELFWVPNFVFKEFELIIFYIPLSIFTIGFQLSQKVILRKTFLILNLILCFFYFLDALFSLTFPIQDFTPGLGNLLMVMLFPHTLLIYRIEKIEKR